MKLRKNHFLFCSFLLFLTLSYSSKTQAKNPKFLKDTSGDIIQLADSKPSQGGQVVESGAYHLELITAPGKEGIHLDLFLQKGDNHQGISNAKVTGQVQFPDGKQKPLEFKYDSEGKHYTVLLPEKAPGQYQLKITADINGEKANGRFSFKQ